MDGRRCERFGDTTERGSSIDGIYGFIEEDGMLRTPAIFPKTILCVLVGCAAIPVNILGMSLAKRNQQRPSTSPFSFRYAPILVPCDGDLRTITDLG